LKEGLYELWRADKNQRHDLHIEFNENRFK